MLVQFDFSAFCVCQSLILSHDCVTTYSTFLQSPPTLETISSMYNLRTCHIVQNNVPVPVCLSSFRFLCLSVMFFYCIVCFLISNFPKVNELFVSLFLVSIHLLSQNYSTFLKLPKLTAFKFYQLSRMTFFSPVSFFRYFLPRMLSEARFQLCPMNRRVTTSFIRCLSRNQRRQRKQAVGV